MSEDAAAEQRWNEGALAQAVAAPAWRLWSYAQGAVVLGRSQRAGLAAAAAASPVPVLARSAGGGAVLVGPWMIGLSVALPPAHALAGGGPVAGYRWLGEGIADALRGVGVREAQALAPAALRACAGAGAAAPDWACFGGLSPWEVVLGPRKIAGLAQVRRRTGVLLVAGVLLEDPPWDLLCRALGQPPAQAERLRRATAACAAHAALPIAELRPALTQALAGMLQERLSPAPCPFQSSGPTPGPLRPSGPAG